MSIYSVAPDQVSWRTSSTCDLGSCVGVARQGEFIIISNTGDPDSPVPKFTAAEWRAFLAGAKKGDFDDLVLILRKDAHGIAGHSVKCLWRAGAGLGQDRSQE